MSHNHVLSWGTGAYGRLGHGDSMDRLSPTSLNANHLGDKPVVCVSAGLYHSAIVTDDGSLYTFGTNATGCLGVGESDATSTDSNTQPSATHRFTTPTLVRSFPPRLKIVQASVGGDLMGAHTLAVSSSGRLYAWGTSTACGLGPVSVDIVSSPHLVHDFVKSNETSSERVVFASAGGSCSAVITSDGSLFTFGISACGRLGYREKLKVQWRPRRVDALLGETVSAVSVGGSHMMCVTRKGELYVWGENGKGQLGLGDLVDRYEPVRVIHPKHALWSSVISAGENHSMAVDVHGRLYTWGACGGPALGRGMYGSSRTQTEREIALSISFQVDGMTNTWSVPQEVNSFSDHRIARVAAGAGHSIAVTSDGLMFAWGSSNQAGLCGTTSIPRLIGPSVSFPSNSVVAVSAGAYHTLCVTREPRTCLGFTFLAFSMTRPTPSAAHDCFVVTGEQTRLWLNSSVLRAIFSPPAWELFIRPQLKLIEGREMYSDYDSIESPVVPSLSLLAYDMQNDAKNISHDRIESILDDWVRETENSIDIPDIPDDCLFTSINTEVVVEFFKSVFSDSVPESSEQTLRTLLKLCICSHLDGHRGVIESRLGARTGPVPSLSILPAIRKLYTHRTRGIVFNCGPPIFRNTLDIAAQLSVVCDVAIFEGSCPNSAGLVRSGDTVADTSPAMRRGGGRRIKSSGGREMDCQSVPMDVLDEAVWFMYWSSFRDSELPEDPKEIGVVVQFWLHVVALADELGCVPMVAAAIDKITQRLTLDTWATVGVQMNRLRYECESVIKMRQLRDSVIAVGGVAVAGRVMSHPKFASGSVYSKPELPKTVSGIVADFGYDDRGVDENILEQVTSRAIGIIEAHSHIARELRRKLEYYQMLDPGLEGVVTAGVNDGILVSVMKKFIQPMKLSLRQGPSIIGSSRDLAIMLAVISGVSAYTNEFKFLQTFLHTDVWAKLYVVAVNLVVVIVSTWLVMKTVKSKA
jgi:alpha-tubulin suppressor-like RCC1 family protein